MDKFVSRKRSKMSCNSPNLERDSSPVVSGIVQCLSSDSDIAISSISSDLKASTTKKIKGLSKVWKYFKSSEDKKYAKCMTCEKWYKTSGNTSNLKDHLKRFHTNFEKEGRGKGDCESGIKDSVPYASTSSSLEPSCSSSSNSARSSTRSINTYYKRSILYEATSKRKKQIDTALMWMIALDFQPFSIVEDVGFKTFVHALDPKYALPSKHTIKKNYMYDLYFKAKNKLREILENTKYLAVTCDLWTSRANEGFLAVTCHFIDEQFELRTTVLSTKKLLDSTNHCSQNVADSLKEVFLEWNILNKISCIVTDNASSMIKACEILKIRHLPCYAHTLNLVVQDVLKTDEIKDVLIKCKSIVRFFKSSTTALEKLKSEQDTVNPLTLIQEVPTRWNSTYYMIKRILEINDAVCKTLLSIRKSPPPLNADEVLILRDLIKLLYPFEEATKKISGNSYVTLSLIIPITFGIRWQIIKIEEEMQTEQGKNIQNKLLNSIIDRLFVYERRSATRIATILDPRFKKEGFRVQSNAEEAVKFLESEMISMKCSIDTQNSNNLQPIIGENTQNETESNKSLFYFLEERLTHRVKSTTADVIITKRQYLERQNASQESDVLLYWKVSAEEFKSIVDCVLKFLCIPATSVESERTFSKAGQLVSEKRSCLKEKHIDMLIFMNKNKWIFEYIS